MQTDSTGQQRGARHTSLTPPPARQNEGQHEYASYRCCGYVQFIDDNVLQVGDHTRVHARRIVIATGSLPYVLSMYQAVGDRALVNDDVFAWDNLPHKVAVTGEGMIGLELGQALAWLGVDVTMLGARGRVGPLSDPAIKD